MWTRPDAAIEVTQKPMRLGGHSTVPNLSVASDIPAADCHHDDMTSPADLERQELAQLLLDSGPEAPTLCDGWNTRGLAAHLAVRDHRLDSMPGLMIPAFASWTEKVRLGYAGRDYDALIDLVRNPPWWNVVARAPFNVVEWFVHHEDVRRAQLGWTPRQLPRPTAEALWGMASMTRLLLRPTGLTVKLVSPDHGHRVIGKGAPQATLTGEPGEIVLFCFGRGQRAKVTIDGEAAQTLREARLGI